MILLDTNVVSELLQAVPAPRVIAWLSNQPSSEFWISAVTVYELRHGAERLPASARRTLLERRIAVFIEAGVRRRIGPLDADAADWAGQLEARRRAQGLTVDLPDTLIAGIALSRRATLATRNVRHFADLPTPVVDPWTG